MTSLLIALGVRLNKFNDVTGPRHVLANREAKVVKVIVLLVHLDSAAKLAGKSVNVLLVCKMILLTVQECDWNVGWNILQVKAWRIATSVFIHVFQPVSIIEPSKLICLDKLGQVSELLD